MTNFFKLLGTFKSELVLEVIRQNPEHIFIMLLIPGQCISTFFFFLINHFVWSINHSATRDQGWPVDFGYVLLLIKASRLAMVSTGDT